MSLPTLDDVEAARARLEGWGVSTPLLRFPALDALLGGTLYLKAENLQQTGSFKYRGALNHMRWLAEQRIAGAAIPNQVLAYSSGNHAQGVAKAAREAGLSATIIMPADAPAVKINRTRAWGAEVILYDRDQQRREDLAARHPNAQQAHLIPPYDHALTIAGQGTLGLEVVEQLAAAPLDQALICCGGGGLTTGATLALKAAYPNLSAYAVEPEGFEDFGRSLACGQRVCNAQQSGSLCDAILTPTPGAMTFALAQACGVKALAVSDAEALSAVAYAAQYLKLILEPGGAVALAAALFGKVPLKERATLIVLSGGNIDPRLLQQALSQDLPASWT